MRTPTTNLSPALIKAQEARREESARRAALSPRQYFAEMANSRLADVVRAFERLGNLQAVSVKQADDSVVRVKPTEQDLEMIKRVVSEAGQACYRKLSPSNEPRAKRSAVTYFAE